jgi:hypothetical protein
MARKVPDLGRVAMMLGSSLHGANRAEAQYCYGGVYGYGAGMGMTLEDQQLLKAHIYTLNATQVQLNEAQALRDYWAAVLLSEQTRSAALTNRKLADGLSLPAANKPRAVRAVTRRRHATRTAPAARRIPAAVAAIPAVAGQDAFDPSLRQP